jgi:hypothetical protein
MERDKRPTLTPRVSRVGFATSAFLILVMGALYSLQYLAPTTCIGSAMSTRLGRFTVFGAVIGVAIAAERWLHRRGMPFLESPDVSERAHERTHVRSRSRATGDERERG